MNWLGPAMVGFVTTGTLMLALRPLAVACGFTVGPGGRKSHIGEVPVIGGVAMFFGMIAGLALVPNASHDFLFMFLAGGILLVVGVIDDKRHVSFVVRIGAHTIAATVLVWGGGLLITDLGNLLGSGAVQLGSFAFAFTVLVCISVINAFNFADGIDGLAASLAAIAIGSVAIVSSSFDASIFLTGIVACAAILGFLLFNFPVFFNRKFYSFMGDAGSTLLGIIVFGLTVCVSQGEARPISPVVGLWFVLVPLADFFTCIIRRIAKGKSPFNSGREHLHFILLRGKLSVRQALLILTSFGVAYAGIALLANSLGVPDVVMFGGWVMLISVQYPLVKKIALTARSRCWKRLRAAKLTA